MAEESPNKEKIVRGHIMEIVPMGGRAPRQDACLGCRLDAGISPESTTSRKAGGLWLLFRGHNRATMRRVDKAKIGFYTSMYEGMREPLLPSKR